MVSTSQTRPTNRRTNTDPKGHHGPALLTPEALPGFPAAPPSGRSQNFPFGDETVFVTIIVLTAVDTSHLNPLPDQEAPTDTAFHRARYSWAQPWRTSLVPRSFLNLWRLKRSSWASLGYSRLPPRLVWAPGYFPTSLSFWCPQVPCRPLRSGAGPLLGRVTHQEGLQSSETREGMLDFIC